VISIVACVSFSCSPTSNRRRARHPGALRISPIRSFRRLYLEHAIDELRHGIMFRERGAALLRTGPRAPRAVRRNAPPGGPRIDDLSITANPTTAARISACR